MLLFAMPAAICIIRCACYYGIYKKNRHAMIALFSSRLLIYRFIYSITDTGFDDYRTRYYIMPRYQKLLSAMTKAILLRKRYLFA